MGATSNRGSSTVDDWFAQLVVRVLTVFRMWLATTGLNRSEAEPAAEEVMHPAYEDAITSDPLAEFMSEYRRSGRTRDRILIGADDQGYVFATRDQNFMALGPTRCNKTAGPLNQAITTWEGPVVGTGPKNDVAISTAMPRSRFGSVFMVSPDGKGFIPGIVKRRWSPLQDSKDWAGAMGQAEAIVGATEGGAKLKGGDSIWARQAAVFLAPLLYVAAIAGLSMRWVVEAVVGQNLQRIMEAAEILEEEGTGDAHLALQALHSVMRAHSNGQKSIILTAAAALKVYTYPGALEQTENPNFDVAAFVAGEPEVVNEELFTAADRALVARLGVDALADRLPRGKYQTLYIASDNALVRPIVAGLLRAIVRATFAQQAADELSRYRHRRKVLWAADEVALTPLHDLPELLGYCSSRGLMVAICAQDLSQIEATWGREHAEGFLSLIQEVMVFPNIRNVATLNNISTVLGKRWQIVSSYSHGLTTGDRTPSQSHTQGENHHLVPVLDPGEIASGHPTRPELALAIRPDGWGWVHPAPYYRTPPWPEALVATMAHIRDRVPATEGRMFLPVPDLDRDGDGRFLADRFTSPDLLQRYRELSNWFDEWRTGVPPASTSRRGAPPRLRPLELSFTAADSPEDISRTMRAVYGALDGATAPQAPPTNRTSDDQASDNPREGE